MQYKAPLQHDGKAWWKPGITLFLQMSSWVIGPVLIGVFFGRLLDDRFKTEPWITLALVGFSFIVSIIGIMREATRAMKAFERSSHGTDNKTKKVCYKHDLKF